MSKPPRTQFLTVSELKKIMVCAKDSDARVLVYLKNREYLVERVGQFGVVPNLTMNIRLSPDGQLLNPELPNQRRTK